NPAGSGLVYSASLGDGRPQGIALDAAGSAYVTGWLCVPYCPAAGFGAIPTTADAFQPTPIQKGKVIDAFVEKLDPSGSSLAYGSYLAGHGFDFGFAIAVDPRGAAYVAGATDSPDFPTTPGAF